MTGAYLAFSDPGHPWFTACLGLTKAELAAPGDGRHAAIGKAASIATESRDAYIARRPQQFAGAGQDVGPPARAWVYAYRGGSGRRWVRGQSSKLTGYA
jgi:hypothetical protein